MSSERVSADVDMEDVPQSRKKSLTPPSRIYPLLTLGDPAFKLPAIRPAGRSPSTESSASPPPSPGSVATRRSITPPRQSGKEMLPSLTSLSLSEPHGLPKLHNRSDEISFEERVRHAKLIRALLVAVNQQWLYQQQWEREEASPISADEDDEGSDFEMAHDRLMTAV